MTDIPWADWNGRACTDEDVVQLANEGARRALADFGPLLYVMAGDTMVIAQRDTDGTITLYDCQVRRVADVAPKETT